MVLISPYPEYATPHARTLSYVAQEMVLHDQRTSIRLQALIVVGKKGPNNQEKNGYDQLLSVAKDVLNFFFDSDRGSRGHQEQERF